MEYVIEKIKYVLNHDTLNIDVKWKSITVGTAFLLLYGANLIVKRSKLSAKRKRKRSERTHQLDELQRSLITVEIAKVLEITELTAEQIVAHLKKGKYSCQEVLRAFQCKAIEAHNLTNCIVQPIKEAESVAVQLENGDKSKALYGLPVSVKDNYCYQGYDSTVGFSKWIDRPFQEDCVVLKVLKSQGAVPFVKTNVPQTMLSWECTNPIYGATTNPLDENKGVGGSSGGEAALIASKGSVLGFGTDIGGSIRIPSAMCGTMGLKPTDNRLSSKGTFPLCKGQVLCPSSLGPMARDVDSLVLAMKALCVPLMWELDPSVPPLPFDEKVYKESKKLKIGFYLKDGFMESAPAMQRGVLEAKTLLESMGHTVVEWNIPKDAFKEIIPIWAKTIFGDQGNEILDLLKDDAVDASMSSIVPLLKIPYVFKKILSLLLRPLMPVASDLLLAVSGCRSVTEMWNVNTKKEALISEILRSWKQNKFDAVICPGFTCPAVPNGVAGKLGIAACYTSLYNTLNFPAGSMPVTTVNAEDELNMKSYPSSDPWHYMIKKAMKNTVGLPVNVQVVTLPWQEELCLRVMKDIEIALEKF